MNTTRALRCGVIAFGAALLLSAGVSAASAETPDDLGIDINVDVQEIAQPGVLAMTVEGEASATLTENGSTDLVRQFTGTMPTVTVTDTRTADQIPEGAFWSVTGLADDFTMVGGTSTIGAENLGWAPALLDGAGESFILVGDDVAPAQDGGPGLVGQELLFLGDSAPAAGGAWSASADLTLRVPATVEPGSYSSVLTLSLFE